MFEESIYKVTYAGNVLNNIPGVTIYNHNFLDLPEREINMNKLARRDKSIITSAEYSSKRLTIFALVCSGNRANTEATLRRLKALLQTVNAPVVTLQGGLEIQYTATLSQLETTWDAGLATVVITLIASDPVGYETTSTDLLDGGTTESYSNFSVIVDGSFNIQPIFTVTFVSVSGATDSTATIRNSKTGQGISVERDWSNGDILYINSATKEITINGEPTDFTGLFPTFSTGTQVIGYTDNFSSRNVDIEATYVKRVI